MVHRANLGDDSTFLHHSPLGYGILSVVLTLVESSFWIKSKIKIKYIR